MIRTNDSFCGLNDAKKYLESDAQKALTASLKTAITLSNPPNTNS